MWYNKVYKRIVIQVHYIIYYRYLQEDLGIRGGFMSDVNLCQNPNREEVKKLLILATMAGRIMLKSGAETYRVEDTVQRICKSRMNIRYADAFIIPTGIFISLECNGELYSYLKRIKSMSIDLNRIDMVNEFSRKFVSSDMSIDEGIKELKIINKATIYNPAYQVFLTGVAAASFTFLFDGSFQDFIASFLVTVFSQSLLYKLKKYKLIFFLRNFLGAFLASIGSLLLINSGIGHSLDKVIIGSIMPLVPGVAITNSIRDTMSGDYISGLSKSLEAVFSALAIALGVGILMQFYLKGGI